MNIYEFCEKYRITMRKAKRLEKDGWLTFGEVDDLGVMEIRHRLRSGNLLSVSHLMQLADNPAWVPMLGAYAGKAREQLAALGDWRNEPAPIEAAAAIAEASKGNPEAVHVVCDWLRQVIPAHPVTHSYVAIRLLFGVPESIRHFEAPRIAMVFTNCRRSESLAGWWRVEPQGSRKVTLYQRPVAHDL